jgi:hypothetical protein
MILKKELFGKNDYDSASFVTQKHALEILNNSEFKEDLVGCYNINLDEKRVLQVGNAKRLLESINRLDSQCEKIDIVSEVKDIQLSKMLEEEKAVFDVYNIEDSSILLKNKSDILKVETRYSAKQELLDYYNLSKFANYCRDHEYEDLISSIKQYLEEKNASNTETRKLRLIYVNDEKRFYLRAVTSDKMYKDFGLNFSVFVALMSLNEYVQQSKKQIFIDYYSIDDSSLYISFAFQDSTRVDDKLNLSFNLILENDEIKRNAVSFNGVFKLTHIGQDNTNEIYLKPKGLRKDENNYSTDLLTYLHKGNVSTVLERINELPTLVDFFIKQVGEDANKIAAISNPNDVKEYIRIKIHNSRKPEFQKYKEQIIKKLMSISVDSTYKLFELLRAVEDLFEHDDVVSRDFWRLKLYEALIGDKKTK